MRISIVIDTDVLIAFISKRETEHQAAKGLVENALSGRWGTPFVTDFIIDEGLTLLMARKARLEAAERLIALFSPADPAAPVSLLPIRVGEEAFTSSLGLFRRHYERGLSFTDCTTVAVAEQRQVAQVASFDDGFDGLVTRVHSA